MKPLVDPKVDFAFKHVFGQEQNKQLLISLLDAVCFVDTPLFPDFDGYHSVFELRERGRGALFTDQMAVHILELPKFTKTAEHVATPLDRWLYFLRHAPALDIDSLPPTLDVPDVRLALGDLMIISQSERERERYESHLKLQRDMYTTLAEAEDRGEARGIEQGRARTLISLIPYLQRVLHHEVVSREQLQALPLPELDALAARLQAEIDAQQANGPSA